jgi:hypothetical protein
MVAVAIGGAAIVGAGASVISGKKAAKAQTNAANQASADAERADATNRYIYDRTRADYTPQRLVGQSALYKLADMYGVARPAAAVGGVEEQFFGNAPAEVGMTPGFGGFEVSPGYQFRVGEAMKAIQRSAAARGSLRSGATMDAIQRRVQGVASDEYENFSNRLAALAGIGQTATAGSAAAGQAYAGQQTQTALAQGQIATNAGNARATAYQNTGSAINNGITGAASAYLYGRGYAGGGYGSGPIGASGVWT